MLGALVVAWLWFAGDARRERRLAGIVPGVDAARVDEVMGTPAACPTGDLEHLRDALPGGTPPAGQEAALDALRRATAGRRVWSADGGGTCATHAAGEAEAGVDADGTVVWIVRVRGRTLLDAAPGILP